MRVVLRHAHGPRARASSPARASGRRASRSKGAQAAAAPVGVQRLGPGDPGQAAASASAKPDDGDGGAGEPEPEHLRGCQPSATSTASEAAPSASPTGDGGGSGRNCSTERPREEGARRARFAVRSPPRASKSSPLRGNGIDGDGWDLAPSEASASMCQVPSSPIRALAVLARSPRRGRLRRQQEERELRVPTRPRSRERRSSRARVAPAATRSKPRTRRDGRPEPRRAQAGHVDGGTPGPRGRRRYAVLPQGACRTRRSTRSRLSSRRPPARGRQLIGRRGFQARRHQGGGLRADGLPLLRAGLREHLVQRRAESRARQVRRGHQDARTDRARLPQDRARDRGRSLSALPREAWARPSSPAGRAARRATTTGSSSARSSESTRTSSARRRGSSAHHPGAEVGVHRLPVRPRARPRPDDLHGLRPARLASTPATS